MLRLQEEDGVKLAAIRREFFKKALLKAPKSKCGSSFLYSNLGYSLLGHIAEIKADIPFSQLLIERVFSPLGLQHTGFGAPQGDTANDQPMGHQVLFGFRRAVNPFKGVAYNPAVMAPAGRLHMSLQDLLAYGRIHLEGERGDNSFIKTQTWKLLHKPFLNDYGCGWVCQEKDWADGRLIWHNGSNRMWYALLLLVPEHNCVLAFTTNDGDIKGAEKAFFDAAQDILAA